MSAKPVVLMLLSRHPYAEKSGRGFMLRQRIQQLSGRFDTKLVVLGAAAGDASDAGITFLPMAQPLSVLLNAARLARLPMQTWLYHSANARAAIRRLAEEARADAVYVDMLRLAPLASDLPPHVARLIDYDDLLSERYRLAASKDYDVMGFLAKRSAALASAARTFARPLLASEAARCAAYEADMLRRSDLALFTSPREAGVMGGKGAPVLAAPPMIAPMAATPAPGRRLIFLGNMRYAENVTMLNALAEAVTAVGDLPDDVVIEAVGDHAPDLPARFDAQRFRFTGRIDDLGTLAGAGVFLAPVIGGSGVKLKVLDGMALGCPVVATPKALEGLSARAGRDLLIAPGGVGVLRTALALRDKQALKQRLAANARAYLRRAHAPEMGEAVCDAVAEAITRAKARTEGRA